MLRSKRSLFLNTCIVEQCKSDQWSLAFQSADETGTDCIQQTPRLIMNVCCSIFQESVSVIVPIADPVVIGTGITLTFSVLIEHCLQLLRWPSKFGLISTGLVGVGTTRIHSPPHPLLTSFIVLRAKLRPETIATSDWLVRVHRYRLNARLLFILYWDLVQRCWHFPGKIKTLSFQQSLHTNGGYVSARSGLAFFKLLFIQPIHPLYFFFVSIFRWWGERNLSKYDRFKIALFLQQFNVGDAEWVSNSRLRTIQNDSLSCKHMS